ncbi:MAG: hypothetical protein KC468_20700, partial [Myxococcales bacterium]|nr:hypothetical protein [Myxococcales bacterium]
RWETSAALPRTAETSPEMELAGLLEFHPMPLYAHGERVWITLRDGAQPALVEPLPRALYSRANRQVRVRGRFVSSPVAPPRLSVHAVWIEEEPSARPPAAFTPPMVRTGPEYFEHDGETVHLMALLVSIEGSPGVDLRLRARLVDGSPVEQLLDHARAELYRPRLGTEVILVADRLMLGGGRLRQRLHGACDGHETGCGITRRAFDVPGDRAP